MDSQPQQDSANDEIDLKEFLRVVTRHSQLVAMALLLALVGAGLYLFFVPPTYQASATVKVPDKGAGDLLKGLAVLGTSTGGGGDAIETHMEVARSNNVALRASLMLGLTRSAEWQGLGPEEVATKLKSKVQVRNVKNSNLLSFDAQDHDPSLAASLAEAWAKSFIDANVDFSRSGARSRAEFIGDQLAQVKQRLIEGEEILRRYSTEKKVLANMSGSSENSRASDPIVALKTQVMNLEITRATLASQFSPEHPRMQEVQAQLAEAQHQLDAEMAKLPKDEMELVRLSRETKVDEAIYNFLLTKEQEARIEENVDETGIVLVDSALVPARPVAPKKRQTMVLALVLGLLLGMGLAFGAEHLDDTVQSENDLAKSTGLVCLGLVPDYQAEEKELGPDPSATLITNPVFDYTFYRESYKILRTNLTFTALEGLKSLSVLSAGPGEGKTLTNANLAIALAQAGKSVLLVDADLRKPSLHELFGLSVTPKQGLPLLIAGQANLPDLVVPSPVKGLSLMPCGVMAPNPAELLGSPAMARVLQEMEAAYDMVVFDGAPVLPVTDSVVLAAQLDGTILLGRADMVTKDAVHRASQHLKSVKAPMLGALLNALDLRKRRYGYGTGYGYGYGGYGNKAGKSTKMGMGIFKEGKKI